jgi:hypothetical protein
LIERSNDCKVVEEEVVVGEVVVEEDQEAHL